MVGLPTRLGAELTNDVTAEDPHNSGRVGMKESRIRISPTKLLPRKWANYTKQNA
jgi:hypothetical protein